jgi:general stress protein YciG
MITVNEAGKKGGRARAKILDAKRRKEIARQGGLARAEKHRKSLNQLTISLTPSKSTSPETGDNVV